MSFEITVPEKTHTGAPQKHELRVPTLASCSKFLGIKMKEPLTAYIYTR
jgi:hypothetical protein